MERAKNEQQIVVAMIIIKISIIIILLEWWNNRIETYQGKCIDKSVNYLSFAAVVKRLEIKN